MSGPVLLAFLLSAAAPPSSAGTESALVTRVRAILERPPRGLRSAGKASESERPALVVPRPYVRTVRIESNRAVLGVELPPNVDLSDLPAEIENRFEDAAGAIAAVTDIAHIEFRVAHPGEPLRPPPRRTPRPVRTLEASAPTPAPQKPGPLSVRPSDDRFPFGQSLRSRTIAVSPGHGYIFFDALGDYATQRQNIRWTGCGDCRGIVEDFGTHDLAVRYLIPLLEGAGAQVVMIRERSRQPEFELVDDTAPAYVELQGEFQAGVSPGGHEDGYRTSVAPDAEASWILTAPAAGDYLLSLWFVAGANRHSNARLVVDDRYTFVVDQTALGRRWSPVFSLYLDKDEAVEVRLSAPEDASSPDVLIADAARLGAGRHASGHAWWQMGAQPFAAHQNAPDDLQARGDVTVRPSYAEWFGADVYVSLHSNASGLENSTAAGSVTYRYNCGTFADHTTDPPASECDDPPGSDHLQELVHQNLIDSLRETWDPNWSDRGTRVANFGEMRELDTTPGVLIETAFHDNVVLAADSPLRMTDNQALHHAPWRRAAAWGIYRGLSAFLAPDAALLTTPPTTLMARRLDSTSVELTFDASPGALGYRVYAAVDGYRFDEGRLADQSPVRIDDLPPNAIVGLKVAALNEAGEGPPSHVVATRTSSESAQVLVIDAFTREDAWVQEVDNRHDTSLVHALALGGVEHGFDGVNQAALSAGWLQLAQYDAVIVALGRESTRDAILTAPLRQALADASAGGTAIFAGGTEIGWALDARGDAETRSWFESIFGARYAADDAQTGRIGPSPGGWFENRLTELALADANLGLVETRFADVFTPTTGTAELVYTDGSGATGVAAVRHDRNLVLGVALDMVVGSGARSAVLGTWLARAVPGRVIPPTYDAGLGPIDSGLTADAGVAPPQPDANDVTPPDGGSSPPLSPTRGSPRGRVTGGCACWTIRSVLRSGWLPILLLPLFAVRSHRARRRLKREPAVTSTRAAA